jgi:hypothetical protein
VSNGSSNRNRNCLPGHVLFAGPLGTQVGMDEEEHVREAGALKVVKMPLPYYHFLGKKAKTTNQRRRHPCAGVCCSGARRRRSTVDSRHGPCTRRPRPRCLVRANGILSAKSGSPIICVHHPNMDMEDAPMGRTAWFSQCTRGHVPNSSFFHFSDICRMPRLVRMYRAWIRP